ncbi:hypothetical protein F4779DRAFT_616154 [Xylariaceae sp. FL0662B]|nr:hypothetical protein F4779DRAFT_616154 [Xylariaceae sp. FL0662B]
MTTAVLTLVRVILWGLCRPSHNLTNARSGIPGQTEQRGDRPLIPKGKIAPEPCSQTKGGKYCSEVWMAGPAAQQAQMSQPSRIPKTNCNGYILPTQTTADLTVRALLLSPSFTYVPTPHLSAGTGFFVTAQVSVYVRSNARFDDQFCWFCFLILALPLGIPPVRAISSSGAYYM